ncbi:hypothetical protein OESDEN_19352 [Oesophagostomum dentatum]|uniref:Uncharacterized protein n=1 Tax=Oesophagostomum dentatum TaxID=61180 RepID=A0A0B1SBN9_OESDE|nr:hypothetical protein OESDEN_19352 [Oesophagostomum dentatum]
MAASVSSAEGVRLKSKSKEPKQTTQTKSQSRVSVEPERPERPGQPESKKRKQDSPTHSEIIVEPSIEFSKVTADTVQEEVKVAKPIGKRLKLPESTPRKRRKQKQTKLSQAPIQVETPILQGTQPSKSGEENTSLKVASTQSTMRSVLDVEKTQ